MDVPDGIRQADDVAFFKIANINSLLSVSHILQIHVLHSEWLGWQKEEDNRIKSNFPNALKEGHVLWDFPAILRLELWAK